MLEIPGRKESRYGRWEDPETNSMDLTFLPGVFLAVSYILEVIPRL